MILKKNVLLYIKYENIKLNLYILIKKYQNFNKEGKNLGGEL